MTSIGLRDYLAAHAPEWVGGDPTWEVIQRFIGLPPNSDIRKWKPEFTMLYKAHQHYLWAEAMLKASEKNE